jgi:hypothetical protein
MLRFVPLALGVVSLVGFAMLLVWDFFPRIFPAKAHEVLAAFPLAMIAFAYLVYQVVHRRSAAESIKAALLAAAFLFWAANQLWPTLPQATLFNDLAIALFVFDVFLTMIGWPATVSDESFAGSAINPGRRD